MYKMCVKSHTRCAKSHFTGPYEILQNVNIEIEYNILKRLTVTKMMHSFFYIV